MKPLKHIATLLALSASVQAAALATYNFDTLTNSTNNFNATYPDVVVGNNRLGPIVIESEGPMAGGITDPWDGRILDMDLWSDFSFVTMPPTQDAIETLAEAVTKNAYISFPITAGGETSYSSFTLYAGATHGFNVTLRSDVTGTVDLGTVYVDGYVGDGTRELVSFELGTVPELQNTSAPVTFSLYFDTNGETRADNIFMDEVTINGTTVPEPSAAGLMVAAGAAALLRRRVRR